VIWESLSDTDGDRDMKATIYDSHGERTIGVFHLNQVPETVERSQESGDIDLSPEGNAVFVWHNNPFSSELSISGRIRDGLTGTPGSEILMSDHGIHPEVAVAADSSFMVVWRRVRSLHGRAYDRAGVARGAEYEIASDSGAYVTDQSICAIPSGGYAVVWASRHDGSSYSDVYGRIYSATGTPAGSTTLLSPVSNASSFAAVAPGADGELIVIWYDRSGGTGTTSIHGQRFDLSLSPQGDLLVINDAYEPVSLFKPAITGNRQGQLLVTWCAETPHTTPTSQTMGQLIDESGELIRSNFFISTSSLVRSLKGTAAALPNGGFFAVWGSDAADSYEIYGDLKPIGPSIPSSETRRAGRRFSRAH
jgi:hypothetical protein